MAHIRKLSVIDRFMDKVFIDLNSGCWLWTTYTTSKGYGAFYLKGKNRRAHRASWEIHNGNIPSGFSVLHKCDIPSCVNPKHLFLGTNQDNVDDKVKKGRQSHAKGEKHGICKLNDFQVRVIKRLLSFGTMTQKEIGDIFNVVTSTICTINTGKSRSHI